MQKKVKVQVGWEVCHFLVFILGSSEETHSPGPESLTHDTVTGGEAGRQPQKLHADEPGICHCTVQRRGLSGVWHGVKGPSDGSLVPARPAGVGSTCQSRGTE